MSFIYSSKVTPTTRTRSHDHAKMQGWIMASSASPIISFHLPPPADVMWCDTDCGCRVPVLYVIYLTVVKHILLFTSLVCSKAHSHINTNLPRLTLLLLVGTVHLHISSHQNRPHCRSSYIELDAFVVDTPTTTLITSECCFLTGFRRTLRKGSRQWTMT
jgi:hypothetical protein